MKGILICLLIHTFGFIRVQGSCSQGYNMLEKTIIFVLLIPIIAGLSIFSIWYITRNSTIILFGGYFVVLCIILLIFDLILLGIFAYKNRTALKKSLIYLLSLLINIPLGLSLIYAVVLIEDRIFIKIYNNSDVKIDNIVFFDNKTKNKLGSLLENENKELFFYPGSEGSLYLQFSYDNKKFIELVDGYMSKRGRDIEIVIHSDFSVSKEATK
jgi:hypothetical protein